VLEPLNDFGFTIPKDDKLLCIIDDFDCYVVRI